MRHLGQVFALRGRCVHAVQKIPLSNCVNRPKLQWTCRCFALMLHLEEETMRRGYMDKR